MPMHSQTTAPVAALCAAVAACLLATTVVADPAPAATGSINVEESAEKQLADCMAIWEPRTHMTKQEWRRTCKTSLQDLPSP